MRVLIVDDQEMARAILREVLVEAGHDVVEANDGVQALAMLEQHPVDAIVSDLLMPRMDGFALCREIRARPALRKLPFVLYTGGYDSSHDEQMARQAGADRFLSKRSSPDVVVAALHELAFTGHVSRPESAEPVAELVEMREYNAVLVRKLEEKNVELAAKIESLTRAEQQLRLQSAALVNAANAIVITDIRGQIDWANPAFSAMTGYANEEVIGRTPRILKSGQHDAAFFRDLWQTILAGRIWRGEFTNRRKDGRLYHGEQTIAPVRAPDGVITHFVGIMTDVTAQREAERARLESEAKYKQAAEEQIHMGRRLELLLASTGEGIFGIDLEGRCTFINRAAAEMLGRDAAEVRGQKMETLLRSRMIVPAKAPAESPIARAIRTGERCHVDHESFARADGTTFSVEYSAYPIMDGALTGAVVTFSDITQRKKLEQEVLRAQRVESVGRLASGIAHDMNNILAPIMMSAPLLRMDLPPADRERTLSTVETSAQRGAELVKQLLVFGRGVEGQRGPVSPGALVTEIVKLTAGTFPKNITVVTRVEPDAWPVRGDSSQLHQVLLNLCVNARDAMPDGGTLTIAAQNITFGANAAEQNREARPGPYLLLTVTDTGSGIPADVIEKIFDPFFTTKELGHGTGLGLSTVLGIVKSHEGFVNVRSEPGRGSTFEIYLPAAPGEEESVPLNGVALPPPGHDELILVVDDEKEMRRVLKETLTRRKYRVLTATDGAEASAVFARNRTEIRLVVTDIEMPFMDGVHFVKVLRNMSPDVKILVSSGLGAAKLAESRYAELASLGVTTVLAKPYVPQELLSAVHKLLHEP